MIGTLIKCYLYPLCPFLKKVLSVKTRRHRNQARKRQVKTRKKGANGDISQDRNLTLTTTYSIPRAIHKESKYGGVLSVLNIFRFKNIFLNFLSYFF